MPPPFPWASPYNNPQPGEPGARVPVPLMPNLNPEPQPGPMPPIPPGPMMPDPAPRGGWNPHPGYPPQFPGPSHDANVTPIRDMGGNLLGFEVDLGNGSTIFISYGGTEPNRPSELRPRPDAPRVDPEIPIYTPWGGDFTWEPWPGPDSNSNGGAEPHPGGLGPIRPGGAIVGGVGIAAILAYLAELGLQYFGTVESCRAVSHAITERISKSGVLQNAASLASYLFALADQLADADKNCPGYYSGILGDQIRRLAQDAARCSQDAQDAYQGILDYDCSAPIPGGILSPKALGAWIRELKAALQCVASVQTQANTLAKQAATLLANLPPQCRPAANLSRPLRPRKFGWNLTTGQLVLGGP